MPKTLQVGKTEDLTLLRAKKERKNNAHSTIWNTFYRRRDPYQSLLDTVLYGCLLLRKNNALHLRLQVCQRHLKRHRT